MAFTPCSFSRGGGFGKCPTLPWRKAEESNPTPFRVAHPFPTEPRNFRICLPNFGPVPRRPNALYRGKLKGTSQFYDGGE